MSYFSDFREQHLSVYTPYTLREIVKPGNYIKTYRWRKQRADRGWSDRDTWGGGEYIMEVAAGILNHLQSEKSHVDWDNYFKWNYLNNHGYKSLNEVADDLNLYLQWYEGLGEQELDFDTRIAIEQQLYSQAIDAMHFVADNIGGLWD